ncbi:hypothetical protein [Chryseobacterium gossypii]|uniref:hypothetical protein n=1 Tax=Chryseobacterium gossypii TaxID=3231602 RepID=UPI003524D58C
MKKILFCLVISQTLFSQVGIGNTDPKGALDIRGAGTKDMGLVLPETANTASMKTPKGSPVLEGTIVWDNVEKCMKIKTPSAWSQCIVSKDNLPIINDDLNTLLETGKTPIRVKRDSKGYPMFTASATGLAYVNSVSSNLYGAGNNNIDYPPLTDRVGSGVNPTFVTTLKFVSHALGGYTVVSDSYLYSVGVTEDGTVYAVGANPYGQLGRPSGQTLKDYTNVTNSIEGLQPGEKIIKVAAGGANVALLSNQGNVFMAGYNYYGTNGNGIAQNSYQTTFKKIIFRTNDNTTNADKFIIDINFNTSEGECISAVSSTNKLFVWGRVLTSGLISYKPNTGSDDGNFGNTVSSTSTDGQYTRNPTNVTRTYDTSENILGGATIKKFIVGVGNSYLLLNDGRLFGTGITMGLNDPYSTANTTSYTTSPILLNSLLYPGTNYTNTSTIADQHKVIDFSYCTVNQNSGGLFPFVYSGNMVGSSFSASNGYAYSLAITKSDLFMKGWNYYDNSYGSRLANNFTPEFIPTWTLFDKSQTQFSGMEYVSVNACILRSTIAVKKPTDNDTVGVNLYTAGDGRSGQGGSTVRESSSGVAMIFKPITY